MNHLEFINMLKYNKYLKQQYEKEQNFNLILNSEIKSKATLSNMRYCKNGHSYLS